MLSVISWECDCGAHLKAMYETEGRTTIRCPEPVCRARHLVDGKVSNLWVQDANHVWQGREVAPLIVSWPQERGMTIPTVSESYSLKGTAMGFARGNTRSQNDLCRCAGTSVLSQKFADVFGTIFPL